MTESYYSFETRYLSSLTKVFADEELTSPSFNYATCLQNEVFSFQIAYKFVGEPIKNLTVDVQSDFQVPVRVRSVGLVPSEYPSFYDHDDHGKVKDQYIPYLKPQECGNKTEVRWAAITNNEGIGLMINGLPTVEVNALPYTPHEIEQHDHGYKLPEIDKVTLRINYKQMGVGGDDSWGAKTHPEFTLYANRTYTYCFTLKGIEMK
ncbi:hypothetical protein QFZ31_004647 [Neobacillus niacini]|nr:hypothetical protein [Neobacillus niacini]